MADLGWLPAGFVPGETWHVGADGNWHRGEAPPSIATGETVVIAVDRKTGSVTVDVKSNG